ncbi:MAG: hypothetical protein AVDCRST_MAG11-1201 [uncultured Gemmatimonadaceae bacterium]|uniref:Uncharacterized protein n=1 Tax=uncultured Gemmatimonadaceae bacterium TaxID=246130 RepID=A0A6J4KHY8_9BACT|nr:MAG: hypothetical protein AVDCRST_MAG11-1201 [uncultured Gemmatimonadaceae bacterium]
MGTRSFPPRVPARRDVRVAMGLRRAVRAAVVAPFVATTLAGCYTYAPVGGTAPSPGAQVSAEITDVGRVALADSLGPSPARVEGRLVSATDSSITLAVSGVQPLRGDRTPWAGERVTLRRTAFDRLTERRLSRGRSLIAGAIALGAAVALAVTLGIVADGNGETGERTTPPPIGEQ